MRNTKSLYHLLVDTIKKYGKKHGGVNDSEIVGTLAEIIGDVMALHDPQAQIDFCKFIDWCVAKKIEIHPRLEP
jgi:hypothetical protein